ncbi:hypothetical protein ACFRAR_19640 [Kitasatospora sp. NPDC056651]|uniref:hypothetical protein n=1 Tax=Kitasatospora sp. NPDC056651 TaxID=3345892 RepID=UPI0036A73059
MRLPTNPRLCGALGLAFALAAAGAAALLYLGTGDDRDGRPSPITPSNIAGRRTACLTGDTTEASGRSDTNAIWAALQDASHQRPLNVQQLFARASTSEQAVPYLAGLSAQHCDLVIALGPTFGHASTAAATANPRTTFVAIASDGQPAPVGIDSISGNDTDKAAEIHRRALALTGSGN